MKKKLMMSAVLMLCVFSLSACSAAEDVSNMMQGQMEDYIEQEVANRLEEELAKASATSQEQTVTESAPAEETSIVETSIVETSTVETSTEAVEETKEETVVAESEIVAVEETVVATETVAETGEKPSVDMPAELSDDIYSFQVSVNGTVMQFPMWYSDFEALGFTYTKDATQTLSSSQYTVGEVWQRDGVKISTEFANLSMNTKPYTECMVAGINFDNYYLDDVDWEIILPKGIQYGVSTKEDIMAAYGTPSSDYEGSMYYKMTYKYDYYQEISLYVYNESGVLEEIEIENMVELEGADNSVNEAVPEIVTKYTAPTAVGDDLYVFNAEIEGHLYTFPCPLSEFLANGFTIQENNSADAVAAGSFDWVEIRYNNQSIRLIVRNYADYATIPENCFVKSFETNKNYDPTFDITIPCGIKLGESEDPLKEKLSAFHYEVEESSSYRYYAVYNPNGSKLDSFEFVVSEGIVTGIEFENDNKPEY